MQIFNAKTQQVEDVTFSVDRNREIVATFADGHFMKFPAGSTEKEVKDLIAIHQEANEGQEIITPEQEAQMQAEAEASMDLVAKLNGNTMSEGNKDHDPTPKAPGTDTAI